MNAFLCIFEYVRQYLLRINLNKTNQTIRLFSPSQKQTPSGHLTVQLEGGRGKCSVVAKVNFPNFA